MNLNRGQIYSKLRMSNLRFKYWDSTVAIEKVHCHFCKMDRVWARARVDTKGNPMNVDDHIRLSKELGDDVIFVPIFVNMASPTAGSFVSMGAIGAMASTVFESVDASTNSFLRILSKIHQFSWEKIWKLSVIQQFFGKYWSQAPTFLSS